MFEVSVFPGPVTVLQGKKTRKAIKEAAELTAFYSDIKTGAVTVQFGKDQMVETILVKAPNRADVNKLRL